MTDARNFLFNTDFPIDKITGYQTGSLTVSTGSSSNPSIAHGLGYAPLYMLKWSTSPTFDTSFDEIGVNTSDRFFLNAQTDSTNLYIFASNNSGASITFYYRVIYFMPTNVDIDAPETAPDLDSFALNTDFNYTKVFQESFVNSPSATIVHDFGYYPQVEAWYVRSSDGRIVHSVSNELSSSSPSEPRVTVTTSSVQLEDGSSVTASGWHYKIYADEV